MDGGGIDVWVGSGEKTVDAIMCIVDMMKRDSEIKLLIGCTEEEKMETRNEMITVIVNKGYADDVMAAARSAGAGGGTVLNARGTARETDQRFFGMHIVPEKEMLVILVPADKKDAVMAKIRDLNCLKTPGMGIAWSSGVEDFALLGKSK